MTTLYDSSGRPVTLGAQLGQGGEGVVYGVAGRDRFAAKVYHRAVDAERTAKLTAMVRLGTERLHRLSAWPVDTLHTKPNGPVMGLVMTKLTGYKAIHKLYGPKTRLAEFPSARWPFLIHTSMNLARAFADVHEHGHVVGDVNHGNVLASDDGTVKFIDCDSFQISDNGRTFLCEVGVSTHTPAELQGISLAKIVRSPNHDSFGLAVVIFQLLFMGKHPFAGTYLGKGDMPIEQAIKDYRFVYGSTALSQQMKQPPASLGLDAVSQSVALLFERAFSPQGSRDGVRPSAREWVGSLEGLAAQLRQCQHNPSHSFLRGLTSCPWCEIEMRVGTVLFNIVVTRSWQAQTQFNLTAVWAQITAVQSPGPAPGFPDTKALSVRASQKAKVYGRWRRASVALGVGVLAAGIITVVSLPLQDSAAFWGVVGSIVAALLTANASPKGPRVDAQRQLSAAQARWQMARGRWQQDAGDDAFQAELADLRQKRQQYEDLPTQRQRRLTELQSKRRQLQLQRFLEQFRLARSDIRGIGAGRKATLQSYGIETAADITESAILAIPGFGPSFTGNLVSWRRTLEHRFVFDPNRGIDQRDIDAVERDIAATRAKLEQALVGGGARLSQIVQQTIIRRQSLRAGVEQLLHELAQAEADTRAF